MSPRSKKKYNLLVELVITEFKLRYQGSVLGYLWSLLKPLMLFTVMYFVFTRIFRFGDSVPNFAQYLLLGVVVWSFFVEATSVGMGSIVARGDLIRKIGISKSIIVISSVVSAFINLAINLGVVLVFALIGNIDIFSSRALLAIPVLIELFIFAIAVAFFLAAVFTKFRDIGHIWDVLLQAAFYGTPIIYPFNLVPESLRPFAALNPMAQIIQDLRYALITPETLTTHSVLPGLLSTVPFLIVGLIALIGASYFSKHAKQFAEQV